MKSKRLHDYIKSIRALVYTGLLLLLVFTVGPSSNIFAQPNLIPATGRGNQGTFLVTQNTNLNQPIYFYYVSRGNETRVVELTLEGPGGATATVEAAKFSGDASQAAERMQRLYRVELRNPIRTAHARSLPSQGPGNYPGGCTQEQYELYLQLITNNPELSGVTPEAFCRGLNGGGSGGGGGNNNGFSNRISTLGLLRKDTCANKNSRYLVRMRVDLSRVDRESLGDGVEIKATFRERRFTGSKAATIKPTSEGMFAPHPLLLMSSLGSYRNEKIFQTRWTKAGALRRRTAVRIENYVFYRGLALTRSVVTNLLRQGGRATFDISDGNRAYSVCFRMQRIRQSVNGYPISGDRGA